VMNFRSWPEAILNDRYQAVRAAVQARDSESLLHCRTVGRPRPLLPSFADKRARFIPNGALSGYPLFGPPAALPVLAGSFRLDRTAARATELADLLHPPM
jgi:hypothetical protein